MVGRTLKHTTIWSRNLGLFIVSFALIANVLPWSAASAQNDVSSAQALALLNSGSCGATRDRLFSTIAQVTPSGSTSPSPSPAAASPSPGPSATFPNAPTGPIELNATPQPSSSPVTPPPVPTPTPTASPNTGPVFLIRPTGSPKPIVPVGAASASASPSPLPTAAGPTPLPTLKPGDIAVLSDDVSGNTNDGQPGDATGNVNIFYQDGILVGDRAHYDGKRTMTVTGNPYIINREKNSILHADVIEFDTVSRVATMKKTRGESTQGVERGEVYYSAQEMTSTSGGVAHGSYANVTTCVNPRAGYHITGRTIDVKPGDRITITKAVLFLGAAAVFYLPRVVIPLHSVDDPAKKPAFFPEVGYNQFDGYYVKAKLGFGKDDLYYGYYRVNYFSKAGLGLGYVATLKRHDNRRGGTIDYYGIKDRRQQSQELNLTTTEFENFSNTLRGQFGFSYNSNFGQFINIPPNTSLNAVIAHATTVEQQTYTFNRSALGSQQNSYNLGFTDQRQLTANLSQGVTLGYNTNSSNFGGFSQNSTTSHINTLTHLTTPNYDYELTIDKSNSDFPVGINKLPELSIRPNSFFPHFRFPVSAQFYLGSYQEPQDSVYTSRADLGFILGPALYKIFGSDFSASGSVDQYAYGTGDLKAKITQNLSLQTPVGKHFVNAITYNESNNNGPTAVPFQTFDVLNSINNKSAYDVMRFYNSDYYNLQVSTATFFSGHAQPLTYQLTARPLRKTIFILGGAFVPGSGQGFSTTNFQLASPFGKFADIQFITDIDWKNKGRLINKNLYYHRIIGDCYEIRAQYNQNLKSVNVTLDILAFPSHAATFGVDKNGPILPGGLNL